MIEIEVTDKDGSSRTISCQENPSGNLMEVLTEEKFSILAICGGMASCGTCHIRLDRGYEALDPQEEDELFLLDSLPNQTEQSRLACQIPLIAELNGAKISVLGDH